MWFCIWHFLINSFSLSLSFLCPYSPLWITFISDLVVYPVFEPHFLYFCKFLSFFITSNIQNSLFSSLYHYCPLSSLVFAFIFSSSLLPSCHNAHVCGLFCVVVMASFPHSFHLFVSFWMFSLLHNDSVIVNTNLNLLVQCPWGSSPLPSSRCFMPPAGQVWAPWGSPSSCSPTTLKWRSQRWTSITTRWTLSLTSAHGESTGSGQYDTRVFCSFVCSSFNLLQSFQRSAHHR